MEEAQKGAWLSICAYVLLAVGKLFTGIWAHSEAVSADGMNNITDILLSIAILIGLKVSLQPADQDHQFGHRKAETVATLIAASFMVLVGFDVWIHSIQKMWDSEDFDIHPVAVWVSLISAIIMWGVSIYNSHLSQRTNSEALKAAAKDNLSDALVSLGAIIGIVGTWLGFLWLDVIAAIVIGFLIIRTGWEVAKPAIHCLMDGIEIEELEGLNEQIQSIEGVDKVIELRARTHGNRLHLELTIGVNPNLSVAESHHVTMIIEETLLNDERIEHVHVHVEPVVNHKLLAKHPV